MRNPDLSYSTNVFFVKWIASQADLFRLRGGGSAASGMEKLSFPFFFCDMMSLGIGR